MAKLPFYIMETETESVKLKLGTGAMKQLEEAEKKSVLRIMEDFSNDISIDTISNIIHLAAQRYNARWSMKDTERLMDDYMDQNENGFQALIQVVMKVFETAGFKMEADNPEETENEVPNAQK